MDIIRGRISIQPFYLYRRVIFPKKTAQIQRLHFLRNTDAEVFQVHHKAVPATFQSCLYGLFGGDLQIITRPDLPLVLCY